MKCKILFVCTGNICRSPTAEGIFRDLVLSRNMENKIGTDSAGTSSWHQGEAPDTRAIYCAKSFGVDLSGLKSRPLTKEDFSKFDKILIMDEQNKKDIFEKFGTAEGLDKVKKLLSYAPTYGEDVPDPYYRDNFDFVFEMIKVACENLLDEVLDSIKS